MNISNGLLEGVLCTHLGAAILAAALVAGCGWGEIVHDKYYPSDWPAIIGAGEDCRRIEGVYENKGEAVDEAGRSHEIWFTDLFNEHRKDDAQSRSMRVCDRVKLNVKSYIQLPNRPDFKEGSRLVVDPHMQVDVGPLNTLHKCERLSFPRDTGVPVPPWDSSGVGTCVKNTLVLSRTLYPTMIWSLGLAEDGTLLVKVHREDVVAVPPVILFPMVTSGWMRFKHLP